ncbi:phosphoenolpyruvate carboxykinase (ATP) [Longibacter salinarum]|uniref:Phosphoenolpyruvate carboxykinase (ATP) n=1 Tax=Longibacter salinarum TaxID=1850348 RepID=A0A2A8CW01_9BACT|nr:phosphoenolpyruvate carboxykinase (ATP) [Longibacter salinarum]PEN12793.1 phosphoenolpyruvate carboxykinase (ATP) [Longibacter salinarum]
MTVPQHVTAHLDRLGLSPDTVHYNLKPPVLYELSLDRGESALANGGPLLVRTDPYTGRSPDDRFLVRDENNADTINWGDVNRPTDRGTFDQLKARMIEHAGSRDLFVQDLYAGWDPSYRMPVRIITEKAWHSLFAYNMFVRGEHDDRADFEPGFTVLDLCTFKANPERDKTNSEAAILVDDQQELVLIGGTHYGGEIKKSIFSMLNYMLPERDVLPMHCSANEGPDGDTAVFFGLSGTGKTTLSADASRTLIGDDEHGWSADGVFNFEGGCYAKMIDLSPSGEPEIYGTTKEFGTILENVIVDEKTREPDFSDDSITRNTRGSYPLHFIPNASESGTGGHPDNVIFLTYDAFGVLPPVSRLTPEQAQYHFLSGYTAKVAGTERGVSEPKATFSTCFGEPFMVRHPSVYAEMLGDRVEEHGANVWLVNTGLTGGPYGTGDRINLKFTRAMVDAILLGDLDDVPTTEDPVFGLAIPGSVPGVPTEVLTPRETWADPTAYDQQARKLADMFVDNFEKYVNHVESAVVDAGPTRASASVQR